MMRISSLGGITNKSRLGSGRSHSAVTARRVAGETREGMFSNAIASPRLLCVTPGSYVNTLGLVDSGAAAAVTIPRAIATAIVHAPWIVSLLDFP